MKAVPADSAVSKRMRSIRRSGTKPELEVRRILCRMGIRYRTNPTGIPGRPDIANKAKGFVIFVHGCFWHRHPNCRRATIPTNNKAFWLDKFAKNVARDIATAQKIRSLGLRVITVWECETTDSSLLLKRLTAELSHHARK